MTKSASFSSSKEPTHFSIFNCFAGLIVTKWRASISSSPPYFIAFAASVFILRANSASSLLKDTKTLFFAIMVPLYGIASITSYLYCHQSEKVEAPAPCSASLSATLYPSKTCWKVAIVNPKSSAILVSIQISSWR